jgi:hypothetical protein
VNGLKPKQIASHQLNALGHINGLTNHLGIELIKQELLVYKLVEALILDQSKNPP